MTDYKVTYDGVDLSPCCERGMTDYVFTIDPLGPATPETRAEVKSARRTEQRKATKELVTAYLVMALVAAAFGLGSLVGNVTDSDFRDIDIHLPFTPEPSGERAEPEESAR